ncbi:MAG: ppiB [Bacteroidetes bacterium]|nr:ppiB [Bacteroidota bacterium]
MKHIKHAIPVLLILFTGLLSSCGDKSAKTDATTTPIDTTPKVQAAPVITDDADWQKKDGLYAVITTAKGKIVCQLEYTKVPMTVANFVTLAEGKNPKTTIKKGKPFYDGLNFHRVMENFMIQGGDPKADGTGDPGYAFPDEFDPSLKHTGPGTLSMANSGPQTNGSQFFITHVATPWLDGKHTIFGHVVLGQSVVNAIAIGDKMDSVRIVRVGKDAEAFDAVSTFNTKMVAAQKVMDEAKKKREEQIIALYPEWAAKVKAKYPNAKRTQTGLYYIVTSEGAGPMAKPGQTVVVHYTGTLWDGKKFDSSVDRGQPFEFPLGMHKVIPGWDEGFGLLKVGSKGKLIIPFYLAYGDRSPGEPIPPKADMIFDVQMIGVK